MFLIDHFLLFSKKIDEKTVISFQSGPNLMSFTFKMGGGGVKTSGKVPGRKCTAQFEVGEKNGPI